MEKIIHPENLDELLPSIRNKKIVLIGGCFDILHFGHVEFIKAAKNEGEILIVLLESDEKIRKMKGNNRPINPSSTRAGALSEQGSVDFIICLNWMTKNEEYDKLIVQIKPSVIALTKGDANKEYRAAQAKKVGAKVVEVIDRIDEISTTILLT